MCAETLILLGPDRITDHRSELIALMSFYLRLSTLPLKSKIRLEAENAILQHQLIVLERKIRGRVRLTNSDRLFFIWLYRRFPSILEALRIIRPETLVRWHRAGFRRYWRWKSRSTAGQPQIDADLRALIRQMTVDNPLWRAPRIHGELPKLGFEVALRASLRKHHRKHSDAVGSGSSENIRIVTCMRGNTYESSLTPKMKHSES